MGVIALGKASILVGILIVCEVFNEYEPIVPVPDVIPVIVPPLGVFIDIPTDRVPDITEVTVSSEDEIVPVNMVGVIFCAPFISWNIFVELEYVLVIVGI